MNKLSQQNLTKIESTLQDQSFYTDMGEFGHSV